MSSSFEADEYSSFLLPRSSRLSSASNSPLPSRSTSPLPQFAPSSSCPSDTDSEREPRTPLLRTRVRDSSRERPHSHSHSHGWSRRTSENHELYRWWNIPDINVVGPPSRSRRRARRRYCSWWLCKLAKKHTRRIVRHRFFPQQPITIVLSLLLLSIFAVSLTLLIIDILNPDKAPLPWRAYCSLPSTTTSLYTSQLEQLSLHGSAKPISPISSSPSTSHSSSSSSSYPSSSFSSTPQQYPFAGILPHSPSPPSPPLESLPPVGIFAGVFTVDSAFERRMLIRTTWASHARSRDGAGHGDGGRGTSRTIVRFIMGTPRPDWERRISAEMQMYNDIVILPITESMNNGKSHTFFSWSALDAWVPPIYPAALRADGVPPSSSDEAQNQTYVQPLKTSYSNYSSIPPPLAPHDPTWAYLDAERAASLTTNDEGRGRAKIGIDSSLGSGTERESMMRWVRPDYVVKIDDDSFVMLAELEARLRVELYAGTVPPAPVPGNDEHSKRAEGQAQDSTVSTLNGNETVEEPRARPPPSSSDPNPSPSPADNQDPLVYWGYLVKNRYHTFMAGELYAMSWALVDWVSKSPDVKGLTKGAEDKQTSKWMKLYPGPSSADEHRSGSATEKSREVRWVSERCWIYDHPRAGTVYAHGFLFPSEVAKIKKKLQSYFDFSRTSLTRGTTDAASDASKASTPPPPVATPAAQVPATGALSTGNSLSQAFSSFSSLGLPLNLTGGATELHTPPESWSFSTVSVFRQRYTPPLPTLSFPHSVEAMIEGSPMSSLKEEGSPMSPDFAWKHREGRVKQYEGKRVGGTVVIHFIKKNLWFLETALAMLEGEEVTEGEMEDERGRMVRVREMQDAIVGAAEEGVERRAEAEGGSSVVGPLRSNQLWRTAHTRRARMRSGKTTWSS